MVRLDCNDGCGAEIAALALPKVGSVRNLLNVISAILMLKVKGLPRIGWVGVGGNEKGCPTVDIFDTSTKFGV